MGLKDVISSTIPMPNDKYTPLFIWGPPGIGKSQIVAQVAKELNYSVVDIRLQQMGAY